jgi:hypothetical protein
LLELLNKINDDEKLMQVKENCSNDMLKYIQGFLPLTMDIQYKIISKYGFESNNAGNKVNFRAQLIR